MIRSVRFAAAALVIVLGASGVGPAAAAPADDAEAAAQKVLDRRYQRSIPMIPMERMPRDKKDGEKPKDAPKRVKRKRDRNPEDRGAASALGGVMRLVVFAVLGIGIVMLLMWLLRDLRKGPGEAALEGEVAPDATVDQDVLERPVGDADELARAGKYAEAIHTLLLRTLIELVRATRTRVPAALTSREILARVPLVPPARTALDALVGAVEVTYFGDDVPGPEDYLRCRAEFQRFADAYRGGA